MRYAIYHTPEPDAALTRAAACWLGRDAFGLPAPELDLPKGWTRERHAALVRDAARYGFHATLKAPFELAAGVSKATLLDAFSSVRAMGGDVVIPSLVLRQVDGFFALVSEAPVENLNALAGRMVREFDPLRAPLSQADIARRNPEKLSERQRANLERWGYPYVFEEFFFHMTLSGRVHGQEADETRAALEAHFSDFIGRPHAVSHIALFEEPAAGADFTVRLIRPVNLSNSSGKT